MTNSLSSTRTKIQNTIAIASGKGGVGKSTTTVTLARILAKLGYSIGILDADIYGPSLAMMTKVSQPTQMNHGKVVPPQVQGIKIISSSMFSSENNAHILRGPMAANFVRQFLTQVDWGELDFLLIDYPPGTGDIQLTLSQQTKITVALIVTTPQQLAIQDAKKAISMFETLHVPILGVVETMSFFTCMNCKKTHHIFSKNGGLTLANEYNIPLLGQLPLDPELTIDCDLGKMLNLSQIEHSSYYPHTLEIAKKVINLLPFLKRNKQQALGAFSLTWQ